MKAKKVLILYWTGVKSTKIASEQLAACLGKLDIEVVVISIEDLDQAADSFQDDLHELLNRFDLIVFAAPVYEMEAAEPMRNLVGQIRRLSQSKPAYILMLKSGVSGEATRWFAQQLKAINLITGGWIELLGPSTDMVLLVQPETAKRLGRFLEKLVRIENWIRGRAGEEVEEIDLFRQFAGGVIDGLRGGSKTMEKLWQAAGEITSILETDELRYRVPWPKFFSTYLFWGPLQTFYFRDIADSIHRISLTEPSCNQCGDDCTLFADCPEQAWERDPTGNPIFLSENVCVGCQRCVMRCPWKVVANEQMILRDNLNFPRFTTGFYRQKTARHF